MGRLFALFDPPGYSRCSEPGADFRWTGRSLLEAYTAQVATADLAKGVFNPPGSDWILPKPRQWSQTWYQDADFAKANLDRTKWVWASGISPLDYVITDKAGSGPYPDNKWFVVPKVPAGLVGLDATDYAGLFTAAGQAQPSGIGTIALAGQPPLGGEVFNDHHPFLQFLHPPAPDDVIVFGFWNLALIMGHDIVTLMRSRTNDGRNWEFLGSWSTVQREHGFHGSLSGRQPTGSLMGSNVFKAEQRLVTVMPVGPSEIWLFFSRGDRAVVNLAPARGTFRPILQGMPWWIGAAPGQKIIGQVQVVCYPSITLTLLGVPNGPLLFDLGATYLPTIEPGFNVPTDGYVTYVSPGASDAVFTRTQNEFEVTSAYAGTVLDVRLKDEANSLWSSDGTHHAGGITIGITPGSASPGHFGYLTPQLRLVELKIPVGLTPRTTTPLTLNDKEFCGCRVECSLREAMGKRFTLDVWDKGAQKIINAGLDGRGEYPIEIWEDTNGDGTPDVRRIAAWIFEPKLKVLATEGQALPDGSTRAHALQKYRLEGIGVAQQANAKWEYLPQFVNTSSQIGTVEHTYAVEKSLLLSGIDVLDATKYFEAPDPFTGSVRSALPKTKSGDVGEAGTENVASWAPDWDEERIRYCERIATEWAAWTIYERHDGKLLYTPDLAIELLMTLGPLTSGIAYVRSGTVYHDHATAAAAGAPGMVAIDSLDRDTREPKANVVVVTGVNSDGSNVPHFIDRDTLSLTDTSYENFVGASKPERWVSKMAIDADSMAILTRVGLLQLSQRKFDWSETVDLAPWQIDVGNLEVLGYVYQFTNRGDYLIIHTDLELISADGGSGRGNHWRLRMSGERVPSGSRLSAVLGSYPGQGL